MPSDPARALLLGLGLGLALAAGCKPDPYRPDAGPLPDGIPAKPWWDPKPGEAANWDIQLAAGAADFDVSTPRDMYIIDLFQAVPTATTLNYSTGGPLTVPEGVHPTAISVLKALTPTPIIVCLVNTGAIRLTDPDAMRFPGYAATPPDRQDPIAAGSVIGWSISEPRERFIDIRAASRAMVMPLVAKRIELAKTIGCDAVAAANNEHLAYQGNVGHGFPDITPDDYASWTTDLTKLAHDSELSIGLRASSTQGIGGTAQSYDWLMIDRCAERNNCEVARSYLNVQKAAFAIEYDLDEDMLPNDRLLQCSRLDTAMIEDGIFKTAALGKVHNGRCM